MLRMLKNRNKSIILEPIAEATKTPLKEKKRAVTQDLPAVLDR